MTGAEWMGATMAVAQAAAPATVSYSCTISPRLQRVEPTLPPLPARCSTKYPTDSNLFL